MLEHAWRRLAGLAAHSKSQMFLFPINGQNSIYTCRELGLTLPRIVLTVFTPCLILLAFPRGLCSLPLLVMAGWLDLAKGIFWGPGCD